MNVKLLVYEGIHVDSPSIIYGRRPIETAVLRLNNDVLEFLLDLGAQVNLRLRGNNTILHLAAEFGTIASMGMLVRKATTEIINVSNFRGETALQLAYKNDGCQKMRMLLQKGAVLYPPGSRVRYVTYGTMPWLTTPLLLRLLAKESAEGRPVSEQDMNALEANYPDFMKIIALYV